MDAKAAGRAIGGMSIAVAAGTLVVPLLAGAIEASAGTGAVLIVGAVGGPLLALAAVAPLARRAEWRLSPDIRGSGATRLDWRSRGLQSAWACAFLVLIAYWTVVTRSAQLLGPEGAGMTENAARAVPLAGGIAGMLLTSLVARTGDRRGPRRPMVLVLTLGAAALAVAAAAPGVVATAIGVAVFSASYWCYLTLVGLQVVRSAPPAAHGRALAALYSAMWLGAAVGGALAATGADWRAVLASAALSWLIATAVAARWFGDSGKIAGRWTRLPRLTGPATPS